MKFTFANKLFSKVKKQPLKLLIAFVLLVGYYFCLPQKLFSDAYATVLESSEGHLLGAKIAPDQQWRFPEVDTVPYRFATCIKHFEDEYFDYHWGVNPISISKAFWQNVKQGRIVRGGSTLTQQVIRLSREQQQRTYFEKFIELILATRLEFRFSKEKILALYASHAPFGGNVVGLDMASWRYFGVAPDQLSWGEAATLAVLPNAPSLIFPGKNQEKLLKKRNSLLSKLYEKGIIDSETYQLSLSEPLPQKPHELPQIAPHLLELVSKKNQGKRIKSSVKMGIQEKVNQIVKGIYAHYSQSEVYNMAVLVADVKTRQILAYVGNSPTDQAHQKDVDIIVAQRSTGSVLKPFLYATMLNEGELLPEQLVADIPTQISGYTPQNFNNTYEGAVPADMALAKSLNIPFVLLLKQYSTYRFYDILKQLQLSGIKKHPDHYGLSIILGGAESSLWEMTRAYTNLASELNFFNQKQLYRTKELQDFTYEASPKIDFGKSVPEKPLLGAGSIWAMFNAMKEVNRPTTDAAWRYYESSRKIAWKTGTSFGNKDAWAIGVTPEYVVGVWVGNATGEGRPSLTGASYASPVMFSVFNTLPPSSWFAKPVDDLTFISVCETSGYLAKENCPKKEILAPIAVKEGVPCPYHRWVHLSKNGNFQVNASCEPLNNIVTRSWFVLPPVMEWFYKTNHIGYKTLPPFRSDCQSQNGLSGLDFIYPKHQSVIYTTKNFGGELQPFIAKAANSKGEVFWYLNDAFLGSTIHFHEMNINASKGKHVLRIINPQGDERAILVEVR